MTAGEPTSPRARVPRTPEEWRGRRVLFVTGRLAEPQVRRVVAETAPRFDFRADVQVLGISVAALMHVDWVRRKLTVDRTACDLVVLPGWCQGDVAPLASEIGVPVLIGPREIQDLPEWLGRGERPAPDLSRFDIEIIAEINHAPRLPLGELQAIARRYRDDGADVIDVGCIPGESWTGVGAAVQALRDEGLRVSIDSFDRAEVEGAVAAGAELVLSCNSTNREWAAQVPAELVAIPDDPSALHTLAETIAVLTAAGARFRLDPILEPIGFGFTPSLGRYFETRGRYPGAPLMMGVGNVTEMSQVDSAGVHLLLAAVCQELQITSILTTEVAPWCRSAVREFDLARRLVRHAVTERALVKRLPQSLLMLRDAKVTSPGAEALAALAGQITDPNVRLFVDGGRLHLINRDGHWQGDDAFEVFDRFLTESPGVDAPHAFYLGYELAKATTALALGKQFTQDRPLNWGLLTREEANSHERRRGADQK